MYAFRQQADYLTPARPRICHVDIHHEISVLAGKRGAPLGYKERLQRCWPRLFCPFAPCDAPQALAALTALALGRVALDIPGYRVVEDRGQRRPGVMRGPGRIAALSCQLYLPCRYFFRRE